MKRPLFTSFSSLNIFDGYYILCKLKFMSHKNFVTNSYNDLICGSPWKNDQNCFKHNITNYAFGFLGLDGIGSWISAIVSKALLIQLLENDEHNAGNETQDFYWRKEEEFVQLRRFLLNVILMSGHPWCGRPRTKDLPKPWRLKNTSQGRKLWRSNQNT